MPLPGLCPPRANCYRRQLTVGRELEPSLVVTSSPGGQAAGLLNVERVAIGVELEVSQSPILTPTHSAVLVTTSETSFQPSRPTSEYRSLVSLPHGGWFASCGVADRDSSPGLWVPPRFTSHVNSGVLPGRHRRRSVSASDGRFAGGVLDPAERGCGTGDRPKTSPTSGIGLLFESKKKSAGDPSGPGCRNEYGTMSPLALV